MAYDLVVAPGTSSGLALLDLGNPRATRRGGTDRWRYRGVHKVCTSAEENELKYAKARMQEHVNSQCVVPPLSRYALAGIALGYPYERILSDSEEF